VPPLDYSHATSGTKLVLLQPARDQQRTIPCTVAQHGSSPPEPADGSVADRPDGVPTQGKLASAVAAWVGGAGSTRAVDSEEGVGGDDQVAAPISRPTITPAAPMPIS